MNLYIGTIDDIIQFHHYLIKADSEKEALSKLAIVAPADTGRPTSPQSVKLVEFPEQSSDPLYIFTCCDKQDTERDKFELWHDSSIPSWNCSIISNSSEWRRDENQT